MVSWKTISRPLGISGLWAPVAPSWTTKFNLYFPSLEAPRDPDKVKQTQIWLEIFFAHYMRVASSGLMAKLTNEDVLQ